MGEAGAVVTGPDSEGLQAEAHERDVEPAIVSAVHRVVDCRSSAGEAMAMIDAAIHCLRVASRGDIGDPVVVEALRDLVADPEVGKLLSCKLALPSSPVVPSVGAVPVEVPEASMLSAKLLMAMVDSGKSWQIDGTPHGVSGPLQVISVHAASLVAAGIAARVRAEADAAALERVGRVLDVVVAGNSRRTMATQQMVERIAADIYAALQADDALTDHDVRVRAEERLRWERFLRAEGVGLLSCWMAADQYDSGNEGEYSTEAGIRIDRLIKRAAAGSAVPVATPTEPVDWYRGTPEQVAVERAEVEAAEARYAAEQDGQR